MPYIKKSERDFLDWVVDALHVNAGDEPLENGRLNYLLFAYCKRHVPPSYNNYKNFIGELNECVAEIRRRLLAPYEDQKIIENGDVL